MVSDQQTELTQQQANSSRARNTVESPIVDAPNLTIFSVPKPFIGHVGVIQRNALRSWASLGRSVQILLFGNEIGTAEYAREIGASHVPDLNRNPSGTPLLDSVFRAANELAKAPLLLYVNCDIVFFDDLLPVIDRAMQTEWGELLLIGRRMDLDIDEMLDFESSSWQARLSQQLAERGKLAPVVCKDFFGFRKGQFKEIPPFAIGRGNWDNWIVHHSNQSKTPVVDCTEQLTALHQNHHYQHMNSGRLEAYVNGEEAEENRRLAGGRHLVSGCAATWRMTDRGIVRRRAPIAATFFGDLPRFVSLLGELFLKRH